MKNRFLSFLLSCLVIMGLSIPVWASVPVTEPSLNEARVESLNAHRTLGEYNYSYNAENNSYIVETVSGTTVEIIVPEDCRNFVSLDQILAFSDDPLLRGGERIIISEVCTSTTPSILGNDILPFERLFTYNTEKQLQKSNYVLRDYFIISVARGAASTLSAEFTATVSPKISGETPYVDLEIGGDLTLQIGVEREFTGPPEFPNNPNNYNSREYRVKFFGDSYKWTQTRNDSRGYVLGTRTGTFEVPTYYLEYCIDHSV